MKGAWLCWVFDCRLVHVLDLLTVDGKVRGLWQCSRCGVLRPGRRWGAQDCGPKNARKTS